MQQTNLTIRLSKKEKATLERLAHIEGMTMTNFIKSKVFNVEEKDLGEIQKDIVSRANSFEKKAEQCFDVMLKVLLTNNNILRKTVAKDFTQEEKDSLKLEINDKLAKLFETN